MLPSPRTPTVSVPAGPASGVCSVGMPECCPPVVPPAGWGLGASCTFRCPVAWLLAPSSLLGPCASGQGGQGACLQHGAGGCSEVQRWGAREGCSPPPKLGSMRRTPGASRGRGRRWDPLGTCGDRDKRELLLHLALGRAGLMEVPADPLGASPQGLARAPAEGAHPCMHTAVVLVGPTKTEEFPH